MTDQAMLAEMARLLAIIDRYWTTHFSAGGEVDASTIQQVHAILAEHRQKFHRRG
jgi:hypothetical protein